MSACPRCGFVGTAKLHSVLLIITLMISLCFLSVMMASTFDHCVPQQAVLELSTARSRVCECMFGRRHFSIGDLHDAVIHSYLSGIRSELSRRRQPSAILCHFYLLPCTDLQLNFVAIVKPNETSVPLRHFSCVCRTAIGIFALSLLRRLPSSEAGRRDF